MVFPIPLLNSLPGALQIRVTKDSLTREKQKYTYTAVENAHTGAYSVMSNPNRWLEFGLT